MRVTLGTTMAVLTFAVTAPAHAQSGQRSAPPPPAPAHRPRIGYAGVAAPSPVAAPVYVAPPVYFYSPGGYVVSSGGYVVSGAPYVVLSDGSVLVNFGNGYERVLRPCAQVGTNDAAVNQTGRDPLGRIVDPPGIAALRAGTRGQASGSTPFPNASACYRRDALGRVLMNTAP